MQAGIDQPGALQIQRVVAHILDIGVGIKGHAHALLVLIDAADQAVDHKAHLHAPVRRIQHRAEKLLGARAPLHRVVGDIQRVLRLVDQLDALVEGIVRRLHQQHPVGPLRRAVAALGVKGPLGILRHAGGQGGRHQGAQDPIGQVNGEQRRNDAQNRFHLFSFPRSRSPHRPAALGQIQKTRSSRCGS